MINKWFILLTSVNHKISEDLYGLKGGGKFYFFMVHSFQISFTRTTLGRGKEGIKGYRHTAFIRLWFTLHCCCKNRKNMWVFKHFQQIFRFLNLNDVFLLFSVLLLWQSTVLLSAYHTFYFTQVFLFQSTKKI